MEQYKALKFMAIKRLPVLLQEKVNFAGHFRFFLPIWAIFFVKLCFWANNRL
jgi:hypothetical protein